jgi:hypothetical protein
VNVLDKTTYQMAREEPCWKNPLMSDIYSTFDVDVKRNDVLLTMVKDFLAAPE